LREAFAKPSNLTKNQSLDEISGDGWIDFDTQKAILIETLRACSIVRVNRVLSSVGQYPLDWFLPVDTCG